LALVGSIVIYRAQRHRKTLSYEVLTNAPVVTVVEEVKSAVQILFRGTPVEHARLVLFKLVNSGTEPIPRADYERAVSIQFNETAQILEATIEKEHPAAIGATVVQEGSRAVISPVLLNPGDHVVVKLLVSAPDDHLSVDGHVVGVSQIKELPSEVPTLIRRPLVLLALFEVGLLLVFLGDYWWRGHGEPIAQDLSQLLLVGVMVWLSVAITVSMLADEWKRLR
jgi:hypothetical protein